MVKPKKHLGQHFLTDKGIAQRIATSLSESGEATIIEVGPGTGVLTQFFEEKHQQFLACEVDLESIEWLKEHYPVLDKSILYQDFLKFDLEQLNSSQLQIIGNFPYNISSQILFRVYENHHLVVESVGMFQKEVAQRVAAQPGNKTYGILSVLLQVFYDIEYLFTVKPGSFNPPPKVDSGVIRLVRNAREALPCDKKEFTNLVKTAFNQRRKTLRNAIKILLPENYSNIPFLDKRAEQLSIEDFLELALALKNS